MRLTAHNQRSSSATLSTLKWKTCTPTGATNPCLSTTNAWTLANATGSTAVWSWDAATGVLAMTGTFQTTAFVSSNANGSPVISDKVVNTVIDTLAHTTAATSYTCVEGTFLATVGAIGCLNVYTGPNAIPESTGLFNLDGNANCVQRTVGGDDTSTGNARGLRSAAAAGACDAVDGAFDLWTVVQDDTATGGQLIISNGIPLANPGTNYLTFSAAPEAVGDGPFNALRTVPLTLDVLANDINVNDPVTVTISSPPTIGTATVQGASPGPKTGIRIVYTAPAVVPGSDTFFDYTVLNGDGLAADTGTVYIHILPDGVNPDSVSAESGVPRVIDVLSNDPVSVETVAVTIDSVPLHGVAFVTGSPGTPGGIRITYTSASGYIGSDSFTYRLVSSVLDATATVTVAVVDTVPNAFSFVSQQNVPLNTLVVSAPMQVSGISVPAPLSIVNGSYSKGCTGTYFTAPSSITNGQSLCVRHTSAATPFTDTVTTVTIGGVSGTFTSTTVQADTTPDAFSFDEQVDMSLSSIVTSAPASIVGITAPAPISVTGGLYSINGGAFTSAPGFVSNGSSVRVRHTTSAAPDTSVVTTLNVGGVVATFTSTTFPYAVDDSATTAVNQAVQIDVLKNDNAVDGMVDVGIWRSPAHGTATVSGSPGFASAIRITYTPNAGYSGADSFEYWVESDLVVDYGLVSITVVSSDTDGDGVVDAVDNCTQLANSGQCDSDGDGYGNRCDGDMNNNGSTNAQDTTLYRQQLGQPSSAPTYNPADVNCSGTVNAQDTTLFRQLLGKPPGPSGFHP